MASLSKTWLTDHLIDFEYKKYIVLNYANQVRDQYNASKLYPCLADSISHLQNLQTIKSNADSIKQEANKTLSGLDWQNFKLQYHSSDPDDTSMHEVEKIIRFAMPHFQVLVQDGKTLFDAVEKHLTLSHVGIAPIRRSEGYLFLNKTFTADVAVYQYTISQVEDLHEHCRMLSMEYISDYQLSLKWNYEQMKQDVINTHKDLPNPAVYAIICTLDVPFRETFLPVAKRYFMQHLDKAA